MRGQPVVAVLDQLCHCLEVDTASLRVHGTLPGADCRFDETGRQITAGAPAELGACF